MTFLTPAETVLCLAVGAMVGAVYYGGLWWTIRRLKTAKSPAKMLFVSWFVRTVFLGAAFFAVMQNDWRRIMVAFGALMAVKVTMTAVMKRKVKQVKEAL